MIQKLKEKSPIKGELILRHEIDSRQREEYVVKTEELNSTLMSTDEGKKRYPPYLDFLTMSLPIIQQQQQLFTTGSRQ